MPHPDKRTREAAKATIEARPYQDKHDVTHWAVYQIIEGVPNSNVMPLFESLTEAEARFIVAGNVSRGLFKR